MRSTLQAIERLHGAAGRKAIEERLPPSLRALLQENIVAAGWYPVELSAQIHLAVRDLFGNGSWAPSRAVGREAAKIDFGGVYRVLLRAVPHATLWDRVGLAWNQYNSSGHSKWEVVGPGQVSGVVTDAVGYNDGMWEAAAGRLEILLEHSGVRARSISIHDTTPHGVRVEVLWIE
jgi:hypothetical protein